MRRGFTLLEVMVAGAILAIGALGILGMLITVIENNRSSHDRTTAMTIAEFRLVELQANGDSFKRLTAPGVQINTWINPFVAGANAPLMVNLYGDDCPERDSGDCTAANKKFAVGVYIIGNQVDNDGALIGKDYNASHVRGELRVLWSEHDGTCNTFDAFTKVDTFKNSVGTECAFISLPFAMSR